MAGVASLGASCYIFFRAVRLFRAEGLDCLAGHPLEHRIIYFAGVPFRNREILGLYVELLFAGILLLVLAVLMFRGKRRTD